MVTKQLPRQQTAGARFNETNNHQETRCPRRLPKTTKAAVTKETACVSRKATLTSGLCLRLSRQRYPQLDENFCILPLYGHGNPISKPQDVPNSKDAITVYYRHRLPGNKVSEKMRIQSTSTIAQMKHAISTFKQYLIKDRVYINNAQLRPEESVVLGWIPGSYPEFSF
jgi:hypothetical protein